MTWGDMAGAGAMGWSVGRKVLPGPLRSRGSALRQGCSPGFPSAQGATSTERKKSPPSSCHLWFGVPPPLPCFFEFHHLCHACWGAWSVLLGADRTS